VSNFGRATVGLGRDSGNGEDDGARHRAEQKKSDQAGQNERDDCVVTYAGVRHRSPPTFVDPCQINNLSRCFSGVAAGQRLRAILIFAVGIGLTAVQPRADDVWASIPEG
jgi:hypothetical protein